MESLADESEHANHRHRADRLNNHQQNRDADEDHGVRGQARPYLNRAGKYARLSDVVNKLRGITFQMKRKRLSQINGEQPHRETCLDPRCETRLKPSQEAQKECTEEVDPYQGQHANEDQAFAPW